MGSPDSSYPSWPSTVLDIGRVIESVLWREGNEDWDLGVDRFHFEIRVREELFGDIDDSTDRVCRENRSGGGGHVPVDMLLLERV